MELFKLRTGQWRPMPSCCISQMYGAMPPLQLANKHASSRPTSTKPRSCSKGFEPVAALGMCAKWAAKAVRFVAGEKN